MKKIVKSIPACLVLAFSSLFADTQEIQDLEVINPIEVTKPIKNSFGYINAGSESIFSAPLLGCGFRAQRGHHGLDLSASIVWGRIRYTSYFVDKKMHITRKKINFLYNFFFFPKLRSQFYAGFGASFNHIDVKKLGSIVGYSAEIVLGKQFKSRIGYQHLMQLQITLPGLYARSGGSKFCHNYISEIKNDLEYNPYFIFTYGIGF